MAPRFTACAMALIRFWPIHAGQSVIGSPSKFRTGRGEFTVTAARTLLEERTAMIAATIW